MAIIVALVEEFAFKALHEGAQKLDNDGANQRHEGGFEFGRQARGDGLEGTDPAAIIARRDLPDGRLWGTTSVSLVALGEDSLRYDSQPVPADPASWYPVDFRAR